MGLEDGGRRARPILACLGMETGSVEGAVVL